MFHVEANKKVDDKPAKTEDDIKLWDTEFVKVDQATLFDLILVSPLPLSFPSLKVCLCQREDTSSGPPVPVHSRLSPDAFLPSFAQAANYLNIKGLLDLTCQTVAQMIKGKTPEEIRKTFNIKNDFTPEEEEEVRRENQWAFD